MKLDIKKKYPYQLLTDYVIESNNITEKTEYEIYNIPAMELVCPQRFDLLAKWLYIDARERGVGVEWATNIYKASIAAFSRNTYTEYGTEEKNSFKKYLDTFDALIDDIKDSGVDPKKSLVPVGRDNVLIDGAHRVAIAAYYGQSITVIKFPKLVRNYNYDHFRKVLLSDSVMGYMADCYARIKKHCYLACLWPIGGIANQKNAVSELEKIGNIIYIQDVYLTYQGLKNFMLQIYGHQKWIGNPENNFKGVDGKVRACFDKKYPVKTILFEANCFEEVIEAKKKIRELYGIENHSVHISDNQEETKLMTKLLYNSSSIDFLNCAIPYKYTHVFNEIHKLSETIRKNGYDLERFVIDSSSVLEIYGMREARDIDYLSDIDLVEETITSADNHKSQLKYYNENVSELIYNPDKHFFFYGLKFVTIHVVQDMKKNRNEKKDQRDIRLCEQWLRKLNHVPKAYRSDVKEKILMDMRKWGIYDRYPFTYTQYIVEKMTRPLKKVYKYCIRRHHL